MENPAQCILEAYKDCKIDGDYISFMTILDEVIQDWSPYEDKDKIEIMDTINNLIEKDSELLGEIGWDLPNLIFSALDANWKLEISLSKQPETKAFWKFCNLMASKGEPKELLLSCTEILSNLKNPISITKVPIEIVNPTDIAAYKEKPLKNFALKFHALMQIIQCCLPNIETIYPSKYLSIVITSLSNFFLSAPKVANHLIVIRRVYTFLRDYMPPKIPTSALKDINLQDLKKISEDEKYLQRKLLCFLFSLTVDNFFASSPGYLLGKIFPSALIGEIPPEVEKTFEMGDRLVSMSLSMDIDISQLLIDQIDESIELFKSSPSRLSSTEDVLKFVIEIFNNSSFRNKLPKELPISSTALISLYIYGNYSCDANLPFNKKIEIMNLIKFQLQTFLPLNIKFDSGKLVSVSYAMIWLILSIESDKANAHLVLSKPENEIFILTYLQNVISILVSDPYFITFNRFSAIFTARFLKYLPERISWKFILDTLKNCPFDSYVVYLVKIFQDLTTKDKFLANDNLSDFENLSINDNSKENNESTETLPKSLPPRPNTKYINLTVDRQIEILNLLDDEIKLVFPNSSVFDSLKCSKLLAYLSFITNLKSFDKESVNRRVSKISYLLSLNVKATKEKGETQTQSQRQTILQLLSQLDKMEKAYI